MLNNSYNLLNEPWIEAVYSDGTVSKIGIRQAFKDADKISHIIAPEFHGVRYPFYEFCVYQLLITITVAAWFKPENKFKAAYHPVKLFQSLSERTENWDSEIQNYLNIFENRFDLFDEKFPFLQTINLKIDKKEEKDSRNYVYLLNTLAPGRDNKIFGEFSEEKQVLRDYLFTPQEFAYEVLYNASLQENCNSQYAKASLSSETVLYLNKAKNLKDTILINCFTPKITDEDEDWFDKPVWEWDSVDDIKQMYTGNLSRQILAMTYFPNRKILAKNINEDGKVEEIVFNVASKEEKERKTLFEGNAGDEKKGILKTNGFNLNTPYTIKKTDNKTGERKTVRYGKDISNTQALCLTLSKHFTEETDALIVKLSNIDYRIELFIRKLDGMNVNRQACMKVFYNPNNLFLSEKEISDYEEIQNVQNKMLDIFKKSLTSMEAALGNIKGSNTKYETLTLRQSALADMDNYLEDFFIKEIIPSVKKGIDCREELLNFFAEKAINIFEKTYSSTEHFLEKVRCINVLKQNLYKEKGKMVKSWNKTNEADAL